jgi:hypothetical protein
LARFSAQLVSITPAAASFLASVKPMSRQKPLSCGHSCSGGSGTLSQRRLPSFSIRNSPIAVGATAGALVRTLPAPAGAAVLALIVPRCCG